MKITYAISLEDFRALQPQFTGRAGHNAGFKGVLVVCVLMALVGVYGLMAGAGISFAVFLIGLGLVVAAVCYFLDKRSVGKAKEKHLTNIAIAYQRMHCPDQRTLEAGENGFTVSCRCGTVTRPWPELVQFSENPKLFVLGTKAEGQVVPKSAFRSEGEVTEFRAFILEKFNKDRPFTSRPIDFSYTKQDFRDAYWVNIFRAGGWRRLLRMLATLAIVAYGVTAIWAHLSPSGDAGLLGGVIGGLLVVPLWNIATKRRKHYWGPLRIYPDEEGLYLQDAATVARNLWTQFLGYLEADRIFLLYYTSRTYRIIPKRALGGQEAAFRGLLKRKLPPYNYRAPFPVGSSKASQPSGKPS